MTITVVGHGYVGLVTATVFADLGNIVYVIGRNKEKINRLNAGDPIIYEPGLKELLIKNLQAKRIFFTTSYKEAIPNSEIIFIAVGTPPKNNGEADLSSVFSVAKEVANNLSNNFTVVACKSTVPVGTNRKILAIIKDHQPKNASVAVASCPEFLREGTALHDTFYPDRVVIGADDNQTVAMLLELHKPINGKRLVVGLESAELIKYASNSILATKISFANLISFFCEQTKADVEEVLEGVGLDNRIGRIFLYPGVGYGGSCFPKDVKALIKTGELLNIDVGLLKSVEAINQKAKDLFIKKVIDQKLKEKIVGIWGLSFKPNTDDIRDAPSLYIINQLLKNGFKIKVYDPEAMKNVKKIFSNQLIYCHNAYEAVSDTSALLILTEWNEFKQINLNQIKKLMKQAIIFDGRHIYDPAKLRQIGFKYISIGRKIKKNL
ncbi:MAG: UDP-glucose/GDP-mannose dehydrogenase family protein [Microgenomates group bacterium]|nr:UDP-glucose/GDP-mannose dehydrogenase family protein [Microgenomates group bacterium]